MQRLGRQAWRKADRFFNKIKFVILTYSSLKSYKGFSVFIFLKTHLLREFFCVLLKVEQGNSSLARFKAEPQAAVAMPVR